MKALRPRSRPTDSPGARAALRRWTADVHERLHGAPAFAALAAGRLDRPAYADLLGRLLGFHRAVAPAVHRALDRLGLPGEGHRVRLARLESDLAAVGPRAAPAVTAPDWSDDAAVGCLYVVDGSTLGGRVIHRQLDYLFGPFDAGRSFFGGGPDDPLRWRRLCAALERHSAEAPARLPIMAEGAMATFALFETCLDGPAA